MKKVKKFAMMSMMAFVIGVLGPVQAAYAATATCTHPTLDLRLENVTNSTRTHNVFTGYDGNYQPIIKECIVYQTRYVYGVYCVECGKKTNTATDLVEIHSIAH